MAAPQLESVSFPRLHAGGNSDGTVTGTNIKEHDVVKIVSNSGKRWHGQVTTRASGNLWNATVHRVGPVLGGVESNVSETVGVTVTNGDGDSNSTNTNSTNVP